MSPDLKQQLQSILGPAGWLEGDDVLARPASVARPGTLQTRYLARPDSTAQVSAVLKACHAAGQVVVPQGGISGLVRGADTQPDVLVLSTERMRRIEEIDPTQRIAVVQSGVTLQALQEEAAAQGLLFPLDLGARGSATLGGNLSTNAGGNRVIRYGMTRAMVLGLEAVLADGTVISSMNRLLKNNTGYDLKQLFIGAEGTLGIVTRIVLRLWEAPASEQVALAACSGFDQVVDLLRRVDRQFGGALSAFEVMWREYYDLITVPPGPHRAPLPNGRPLYVLIESQGGDREADAARFERVLGEAIEDGLVDDVVIAQSDKDVQGIWAIRDSVSEMGRHGERVSFDISVPLPLMKAYVETVRAQIAQRYPSHHCWVLGHLGDGNLHVVVNVGPTLSADDRHTIEEIVYGALPPSGSVSAEHGIGVAKRAYLGSSRTPEEIALMRLLKRTLDPKGILNPGVIIEG